MKIQLLCLALAAAATSASAAPIYEVIDSIGPQGKGVTAMQVKVFEQGDAGTCLRDGVARHRDNTFLGQSHCVRELPAPLAPMLRDGPVSGAYVVKTMLPNDGGPLYTVRHGMSVKNPSQVCQNLIAFEKSGASAYFVRYARISCLTPAP